MSVLSDFFSNIYNYIMTFFSTNETPMETDTSEGNTHEGKDNIELYYEELQFVSPSDDNYNFNDTQKLISLTPAYLWSVSDL